MYGPPPRPSTGVPLPLTLGLVAGALMVGMFGGCAVGVLGSAPATEAAAPPAATEPGPSKVTRTTSASPSPSPSKTKPKKVIPSIPGDGTFRVPQEVKPGTYRTSGEDGCYWARLRNLSGDFDAITANGNTDGPTTVQIRSGDKGFETRRCGTWRKVS